jgi:predicted RNA binding protein YcfA (HicA-like mRNA interferase family)
MHRLGFIEKRAGGSHLIMHHPESGLTVTIPLSRREVPPAILQGIARQMENFNVISRERLQKML